MPDLEKIKERLKWGNTIDDVDAVNLHYREDLEALVEEVGRLAEENRRLQDKLDFIKSEVTNPELRRATLDLMDGIAEMEDEVRKLRGAIAAHCYYTGLNGSDADRKLWEILGA